MDRTLNRDVSFSNLSLRSQLTSFEMTQTENSGVATTLGNFKLNTTNTRTGASQYFSIGDGAGIFISVDVGSGMICGMKGRHGDLGEYFGEFVNCRKTAGR